MSRGKWIIKRNAHGCWPPLGLLVAQGSIWECKCGQRWSKRPGGGWHKSANYDIAASSTISDMEGE